MSFANVVAVNATHQSSATQTHNAKLPSGVNIVGRRVMIFVIQDRSVTETDAFTWPGGWSTISTVDGTTGTGNGRCEVRYHDVTGSEGWVGDGNDTITITSADFRQWASRSWCISNQDSAAPEGAFTNGDGPQAADPPSLSPSWGNADNLWIAIAGADNNGLNTWTGYPANYTGNQHADYSTGDNPSADTGSCGHATAERSLTAATEDPGTFTWTSTNEQWYAATIAIKPAPAGPTTIVDADYMLIQIVRR